MFITSPTVTSVIYTLSLHDALPIYEGRTACGVADHWPAPRRPDGVARLRRLRGGTPRSEEHTSELQSHSDLVCRLLLEKKNQHQEYVGDIEAAPNLHRPRHESDGGY